ncbi:MAG: hypothetical protein HOP33_21655 [Verrucomicrobia bacterium]|nr:hypothetical protein [Verrucomicrobiota bacterium]
MKHFSRYSLMLLVVCGALSSACRQENHWERTLVGPFQGEPYDGELSTPAVSSLPLPLNFVLDVHHESAINDPIIRLREVKGTAVWSRVLIPRLEGQLQPRGRITKLKLNEVKAAKDGFKVMVSCDWTGGGKEGGIIYLNTNYSFRSFALGW